MCITLACAVTRSEVRSTVHPYEASVIGLVLIRIFILPAALWLLGSRPVFTADPRCVRLRDHEGGLELDAMACSAGRRI
jgi:hypothetical protein